MSEAIAQIQESSAPAESDRRLWYPPMKLWQLYLLMVATCNLYAVFWIYRIASDVRDHADSRVNPLAYSLSLLLGIVAVFSGARLTWRVLSLRGGERTRHQNLPPCVSLLVFVAYFLALLGHLVELPVLYAVSLLVFPLPWLLVQNRMNPVTSTMPPTDFRKQHRMSSRHVALLGVGLSAWAGLLSAMQMEVAQRASEQAMAGRLFAGSGGRYTVRAPSAEWNQVTPGTIGDPRSDLELLGPSLDTWAIVYVHRGVALNELVAFRARQLNKYADVNYSEPREQQSGTRSEISYVDYEADDPFGPTWNWLTTAVSRDAVVEVVVSAVPTKDNQKASQTV